MRSAVSGNTPCLLVSEYVRRILRMYVSYSSVLHAVMSVSTGPARPQDVCFLQFSATCHHVSVNRSSSSLRCITPATHCWMLSCLCQEANLSWSSGCSDALVCRSLVIDQLKSPKTDCFTPPPPSGHWTNQNTVLVVASQWWWLPVPLFSWCHGKPAIISEHNSSLGSAQKTDMLTSASRPWRHHVLAEVSDHVMCMVKVQ